MAKINALRGSLSDEKAPTGNPEPWFRAIARTLFTEWVLCCGDAMYALAELEFYMHSDDHPDPYVHKHDSQRTQGEWYFHRAKSAKIGFTLKGLDLTFGTKARFGGILVRAIRPLSAGKLGLMIEGPSKVVDTLLTDCGVTSVMELTSLDEFTTDAFDCPHLMLAPIRGTSLKAALASGPRIGLRAKPEAAKYHKSPYRYHAYPSLAKKEKHALKPVKD
jgi:hypothetical protein